MSVWNFFFDFLLVESCADMSKDSRVDRSRPGRPGEVPTGSLRRERQDVNPRIPRGGGRRGGRSRLGVESSSQAGGSQLLDPTQFQHHQPHYEEYREPPHQDYFSEAHQYEFDAYQAHRFQGYVDQAPQPDMEQPQPVMEEPHQHEGGGEDEDEGPIQFEAGLDGFGGGPYVPDLLPRFGSHVACRLWVDENVSILNVYFNVYLTYLNVNFMLEYILMFSLLIIFVIMFFVFCLFLYFSFEGRIGSKGHPTGRSRGLNT